MLCLPFVRCTSGLQRFTALSLVTHTVVLPPAVTACNPASNLCNRHTAMASSPSPQPAAQMSSTSNTTTTPPPSPPREPTFFTGAGESLTRADFLGRIAGWSSSAAPSGGGGGAVLVGENHEDAAAHALELDILRTLAQSRVDDSGDNNATAAENDHKKKKVGLSLEFYDRESQTVLDEYLGGLVDLQTFLENSRPPANYAAYQPLLDYCKDNSLPAVAANCPRRYTRMVSRNGREFLDRLADTSAARLLPPLPYAGASPAYTQNFIDIMRAMGNTNPNVPTRMLDAQSLWDATMAHSISQMYHRVERVVHVTGYFHIQHRLGTVEHLARYAPDLPVLTVVILPSEELGSLNAEQAGIADLVALTDIDAL